MQTHIFHRFQSRIDCKHKTRKMDGNPTKIRKQQLSLRKILKMFAAFKKINI